MTNSVQENLLHIRKQIREYEIRWGKRPGSVFLLAVSKGQPIEKMEEAIAAGQTAFGESYLQEALTKITLLANKNLEWHFIGPIQSNKTKKIAENFCWVHSVSDFRIAKRLSEQRPSHLPPLNICLEVNISHEKTKSGAAIEDVLSLAAACSSLKNITLRGLMAIPEPEDQFVKQRAAYQTLTFLAKELHNNGLMVDTLSIGMSNDMQAAIAEGSTLVRIGTAIFGSRI